MKQNFEQIIRDSVNNHEVPYEAGAWEKFQGKLPASTPFYKTNWFVTSGLALIITAGFVAYSLYNGEENPTNNADIIAQNSEQNSALNEISTTNNGEATTVNQEVMPNKSNSVNLPTDNSVDATKSVNNTDGNAQTSQNLTASNDRQGNQNEELPNANKSGDLKSVDTKKNSSPNVLHEEEMISAEFYLEKKICKGNKVFLIADNINPTYKYLWSVNNDKLLEGSSVNYKPTKAGVHLIALSVKKNGKVVATKTSSIEVIELPEIETTIKNDEFSVKNDYSFVINSLTNTTVEWDLGDGNVSTESSVNHTYKQAGIYKAKCKVTNEHGCSSTITEKIEVKGLYNIRPDYGFSPNGDNINDEFLPVELKTLDVKFTMNIYARNGQLVYTTNSIQQPWNGLMQDGSKSPFGSYVWVVTLTNEFGNQEVYKGTVTNVTN